MIPDFQGHFQVQIFWDGHNFCEISTVDLSYVVTVKSTLEVSQNFVAFSEYMNFTSLFFRGRVASKKLWKAKKLKWSNDNNVNGFLKINFFQFFHSFKMLRSNLKLQSLVEVILGLDNNSKSNWINKFLILINFNFSSSRLLWRLFFLKFQPF